MTDRADARARLGRASEAVRGAATDRVQQALRGRSPIEALSEAEQDAVLDGMPGAYMDPPAGVGDRLAAIAGRTRRALDGERARRDDAG